ncbi:MAG: ABC transporter permease [Gammaproteobacteria bacterium]|nr:ABC transporter permease [Gammaproteobacteria bacterium]
MTPQNTLQVSLRIGYQQWSAHRLALFMISLAFIMLILIDAITVSAERHIQEAAKHISKDQIWLSFYGRDFSDEHSRQIHQSLSTLGRVCPISVNYDHLPFDSSQGVAWIYASSSCMLTLNFPLQNLNTSFGYAFSTFSPDQINHLNLRHQNQSYNVLGGLEVRNPALRNFIHATHIIWVPLLNTKSLKPTHFILDHTQASIDEIRATLKNAHNWEVTSPMKIITEHNQPNQDLLFFFWSLTIIAILSGAANFTHIMLSNIQSRQPEIALRIMLGAKAHHLLLQFIIESNLVIFICLAWSCLLSPIACAALIHLTNLQLDIMFFPSLRMLIAIFSIGSLLSLYPAYMAKSTNPKLLFSS